MICIAPCRSPSVRFVRAPVEPAMIASCVNGDSDNLTPYCLYLLAKCQNQAWQKCGHKTPCLASWHGVLLNKAQVFRQHGIGCRAFWQWKFTDLARGFFVLKVVSLSCFTCNYWQNDTRCQEMGYGESFVTICKRRCSEMLFDLSPYFPLGVGKCHPSDFRRSWRKD